MKNAAYQDNVIPDATNHNVRTVNERAAVLIEDFTHIGKLGQHFEDRSKLFQIPVRLARTKCVKRIAIDIFQIRFSGTRYIKTHAGRRRALPQ